MSIWSTINLNLNKISTDFSIAKKIIIEKNFADKLKTIIFVILINRYPNLNARSVTMVQVISQLDTDDPETLKQPPVQAAIDIPKKRKRRGINS